MDGQNLLGFFFFYRLQMLVMVAPPMLEPCSRCFDSFFYSLSLLFYLILCRFQTRNGLKVGDEAPTDPDPD